MKRGSSPATTIFASQNTAASGSDPRTALDERRDRLIVVVGLAVVADLARLHRLDDRLRLDPRLSRPRASPRRRPPARSAPCARRRPPASPAVSSASSATSSPSAPSPRSSSSRARRRIARTSSWSSGSRWKIRRRERNGAMMSKYGFSLVTPIRLTRPSSTCGSSAACCDRDQRWISSTISTVGLDRARARAIACFRSATPSVTALSCSTLGAGGAGDQAGERGLARAGRSPQDQRAGPAGFDGAAQRLSRREQASAGLRHRRACAVASAPPAAGAQAAAARRGPSAQAESSASAQLLYRQEVARLHGRLTTLRATDRGRRVDRRQRASRPTRPPVSPEPTGTAHDIIARSGIVRASSARRSRDARRSIASGRAGRAADARARSAACRGRASDPLRPGARRRSDVLRSSGSRISRASSTPSSSSGSASRAVQSDTTVLAHGSVVRPASSR